MEGLAALCKWDEDGETYGFEFDGENKADESRLSSLLIGAGLELLPPTEEIEEGESWTIDLADGRAFFASGGTFAWQAEIDPGPFDLVYPGHVIAMSMMSLSHASEEIDGKIEAAWTRTLELDGVRTAEIALDLSAEFEADLSEALENICERSDQIGNEIDFQCAWTTSGEGKLFLNLEEGHLTTLELELENEISVTQTWDEDVGRIAIEADFSGTTTLEAECQ
ncbi:MAG: hypothetical protein ACI8X5_003904 [Planctomycetota bacterium]